MRAGPLAYVLAGAALLGLTALAFAVGRYPVAVSEILNLLLSKLTGEPHGLASNVETVVLQVRGPRVLAALVVASVALSSDAGRVLSAMRDNDERCSYLGINTSLVRIGLTVVAGVVAALAFPYVARPLLGT